MTQQPSASESPATLKETAAQHFDRLLTAPHTCAWCFGVRRRYYSEYDTFRDFNLDVVKGRGSLLQVVTATSDPDPRTYQEVVPPKKDDRGRVIEPPRPKTICECGTIDYDLEDPRPTRVLYEAVENIAEHFDRDDIAFDTEAAKQVVKKARKKDSLAGKDQQVLTGAIYLGLKHA